MYLNWLTHYNSTKAFPPKYSFGCTITFPVTPISLHYFSNSSGVPVKTGKELKCIGIIRWGVGKKCLTA